MRLLDLFCGAGGCAVGYHRAGFTDIVGVDVADQPNYMFEFHRADAMSILSDLVAGQSLKIGLFSEYRLNDFAAIHASPPCQGYCALKHLHPNKRRSMLIPVMRDLLIQSKLPFVIENVPGAPLECPVKICGSAFGLRVRRHRLFESNARLCGTICDHGRQGQPVTVAGTGGKRINRRKDDHGGSVNMPLNLHDARHAMGIDWMTRAELSQAIPPLYTEFVGKQLLAALAR